LSHSLFGDEADIVTYAFGYQFLDTRDLEVFDAIQAGLAGTVDPRTGTFNRLTEDNYGGLWFRSKHSGTIRIGYEHKKYGIMASIRAQYIGRFGDEALDVNGPVHNNRKVPDRDIEYVPGYTMVNIGFTKELTFSKDEEMCRITLGINNLLNVMNLRSMPNLVGRQLALSGQYIL